MRRDIVENKPLEEDTQNEVFLDFMDMVGQQFDEVWSYLRHFTDINERVPKVSEGISKDIVKEVSILLAKRIPVEVERDSNHDVPGDWFKGPF